jgi:hypothetical protein
VSCGYGVIVVIGGSPGVHCSGTHTPGGIIRETEGTDR